MRIKPSLLGILFLAIFLFNRPVQSIDFPDFPFPDFGDSLQMVQDLVDCTTQKNLKVADGVKNLIKNQVSDFYCCEDILSPDEEVRLSCLKRNLNLAGAAYSTLNSLYRNLVPSCGDENLFIEGSATLGEGPCSTYYINTIPEYNNIDTALTFMDACVEELTHLNTNVQQSILTLITSWREQNCQESPGESVPQ